ncbi:MAG TPA: lipoyl(octanoyl) transferase LipB [Tepidisphaeraceae bacterium]|nr:lipoyl(octanoyl) transferase LipB [Tepidisphaeraceae bacterium]
MLIHDLQRMPYREAWTLQEKVHAEVLAGAEERILFVEHPPVITFGRRAETMGQNNLLASADALQKMGVEVVQSDRGGDITFHGPGQLVIYPIIRLADHKLSVGGYVRRLQEIVIAALHELGVETHRDESAIGVWAGPADRPEKICSLGVRIRRGVSMHGLALNVTTDLSYFNLIVPCGLCDRGVTSIQKILGDKTASMDRVKQAVISAFSNMLFQ